MGASPVILVIEDSEVVRKRVREALLEAAVTAPASLHLAGNGIEGIKTLAALDEVDLVLCDLHMPDLDGLKFLGLKASMPGLEPVPVIMLTGVEQLQTKLQCLSAGASDYITKPFHDKELIARVKIHLQLKQLRDELFAQNQRLEELSRTDALTNVPNRRNLMEEASREFSRAGRSGQGMGLVMLDLDHFKMINDKYGHQGGDAVLREIAARLRDSLRGHDQIGRYGGEEFALVLPDTSPDGAKLTAERCRRLVSNTPVEFEGQQILVTASFGVSHFGEGYPKQHTLEALFGRADEALYVAKEAGRDRVEFRALNSGEKLVPEPQAV